MAQINWSEDIQNFFNHDIGNIFKNIFKFPTTCIKRIREESQVKSVVTPLITLFFSFIFCTLFTLMWGIDFGNSVLAGLIPVFYMIFLAIFFFIAMAIKGKADISTAFSHTSTHGLNFTLVWFLISLCFLIGFSKFIAILLMLIIVYGISMGISNTRQSLGGIIDEEDKEAFTWWISPAVVLISLYLAFLIFGKTMNPLAMLGGLGGI